MPGLRVFSSNRLEILAEQLAVKIREPLSSPFDKDIIVVQSKGMARWLSLELAGHNGILANCLFPFPNSFLNYLCRRLTPDASESTYFDPEVLTFSIMKFLPLCKNRAGYEAVRTYLRHDTAQMKLVQLSEMIADVFDDYSVYRPEMIIEWENKTPPADKDAFWQADLWREIVFAGGRHHRTHMQRNLLEKLADSKLAAQQLPDRISAFGISHLPRFHLQILQALSAHVAVDLFLMNPCREYWGDLVTRREARQIKKAYGHKEIQAEDLHLESGNRLMESMGVLGRDFFDMVQAMQCELHEDFKPAASACMLSIIQNDILDLVDPSAGPNSDDGCDHAAAPSSDQRIPFKSDTSIQVHAAHSPMREVEILYDNLLSMFEESPNLLPGDIIVMTPDIEAYAPFINAVFTSVAEEDMRIPFSVADRNVITESSVISSFMAILALKESRLEATRVMSLLEYSAIREKFEFSEKDVDRIHAWVNDINIRWGRDGESRLKLGLPGFVENTWKAGIDRLLLGYAMSGNGRQLFCGILPYDAVEGDETQCLGKFLEFLDSLFYFMEAFDHPKSLGEWSSTFLSLAAKMLHSGDDAEREAYALRKHLGNLASSETTTGFEGQIEFAAIKSYLQHAFKKESFDSGFISGGVTCCALLPMRSIPFKVVCLIGLNNDNFPRDVRTLGFDLTARHPLPGDRSVRNDDKYLFLEAIVSSREKLYLSFVGQHIQDNSKIMPSVLLSELLEYMQERFGLSQDQVVVYHPLQAFSRKYFKGRGPFLSYSMENFKAAEHASQGRQRLEFFTGALSRPSNEWRRLEMDALCGFFINPAKFLLQKRLGVFIGESQTLPDEKENFRLERLEKYLVEQELIHHQITGCDLMEMQPVLKARGILPYGNIGAYEFNELTRRVEPYVHRLAGYLGPEAPQTMEVNAVAADFVIHGILRNICSGRMIQYRYAKTNPRDMLRLWIYHLAWCCGANSGDSLESVFIFRDAVLTYRYVKDSRQVLSSLLDLFWDGLQRPLPFFPLSAHAYAEQRIERSKPAHEALRLASRHWLSTPYARGEYEDPYISLCFSESDALDGRFMSIAESIFLPLMSHTRLVAA
jgi:exodeoxyribonuclease V gamma subunit